MNPSYMQTVAPLAVIIARLQAHMAAGKMLAGLALRDIPVEQVQEGESDLPNIGLFDFSEEEQYFAGGSDKDSTSGDPTQNRKPTQQIKFLLAVSREQAGWLAMVGPSATAANGLMEWITLVKNALETDPLTGALELSLRGTVTQPHLYTVEEVILRPVSMVAALRVTVFPYPVKCGTRLDMLPVPPN
jgi:hypothetical protein